ncbi:MAG TPA: MEDS domain-containing protein [Flavobacteriales bacterium]|nr:MEDS domain-containing protein [Flavobacteriales bacterium]
MASEPRHQCLIYEGPPSQKLPLLASALQSKLHEGYRCLYLNSAPMVAGMGSTLAAMGIDVASETAKARLVFSSDPVALPGEDFNYKVLLGKLEDSINQAIKDGYKGLWASGDMTWEFGPRQDFSKLMEYELKLEELFGRRKELYGVCQYHKDTLPQDVMRQGLLLHRSIVISDTLIRINPHYLKSSWPADLKTSQELDETIAALCAM